MSKLTYPPLSASLVVKDAEAAIDFYRRAFSATERYRLTDPCNGTIGHAELDVNGSMFMLSEENSQSGKSPQTLGATPVKFCLMVDNADALFEQAIAAGATSRMPLTNMFYGYRTGSLIDPFGHEWLIQTLLEEVSPEEMQRRWNESESKCKTEDG
jgi:PhnB protein